MQVDAAEHTVLAEAATAQADAVLAVTRDHDDNLVITQVAMSHYQVPRTVARINHPKNNQIVRMLGIDATVSSTDIILGVLEQELPSHSIVPLLRLRHADVDVVEAILDSDAPVVGKAIRELGLPAD